MLKSPYGALPFPQSALRSQCQLPPHCTVPRRKKPTAASFFFFFPLQTFWAAGLAHILREPSLGAGHDGFHRNGISRQEWLWDTALCIPEAWMCASVPSTLSAKQHQDVYFQKDTMLDKINYI